MSRRITTNEKSFMFEVRPLDRPVVPNAEVTSNITSTMVYACPSALTPADAKEVETDITARMFSIKAVEATTKASLTELFGIALLKADVWSLFFIYDQMVKKIIPMVVLRIPPAVDDGPEPINIIIERTI